MYTNYYGEFAALLTAIFWTITALAFEFAVKRVGTYTLNVIRLGFAFILLATYSYFRRGLLLPIDASQHALLWLSLSGIVGFLLGDMFLFRSFAIIGSRIAMLIMTMVPIFTTIFSWFLLNEILSIKALSGMCLVVGGIFLTIWSKKNYDNKFRLQYPLNGLIFAFLGAIGQAGGLVLSKFGMGNYDPFASTHIRIMAGFIGFVLIITILRKWKFVKTTFSNKPVMAGISIGSVFGPFLGVSFSLIAVQFTHAGIAATLMSIVPILIIPPAIIFFKQNVSLKEIIGAFICIGGVTLFFL